jgi:hypothetical protein
VTDDDLFDFISTSISSVWALEVLLLLNRYRERSWQAESLIQELRSSPVVIEEALKGLQGAGLVMQDSETTYRYRAASAQFDELVSELQETYAAKPMAVIKAIMSAPTDKLRAFSDAFKLKS